MLTETTPYRLEKLRDCLREPVPELTEAAQFLQRAVAAHFAGDRQMADEYLRHADMPCIRDWTESLWGSCSRYRAIQSVEGEPPLVSKDQRVRMRMPDALERRLLLQRDAFSCRFCSLPVIRAEIRRKLHQLYPEAVPWGRTNDSQHAALQAMWAQFDHILPHSRGGDNSLENMVVACAPCNFGRMDYTLAELGLSDPRLRPPISSRWDGLERMLSH